mgnify:CR=1 FL=1
MKTVRIFAIISLLTSAFYSIIGVWGLLSFEKMSRLMGDFKSRGIPEMQQVNIADFRLGLLFTFSILSIIGLLTLVSGIGLFLVREWARKLWLGVATFLVPFYFYWSYSHYVKGYSITEDVIELIVALLIAIVSWKYLTKNSVKKLFRDEKKETGASI